MGATRLLLVDDQPALRDLLTRYVQRLGYDVAAAGSAEEAWAAAAVERFDIYMLDLSLPGMQGEELAQKLLQLQPEASILFVSGHSCPALAAKPRGKRIAFIQKPFQPRQLMEELRRLSPRPA